MAKHWYVRTDCPGFAAAQALKRLNGRWKTPILVTLAERPHRYAELRAALGTVTDKMLGQQLSALQADSLIERNEIVSAPPKTVEYRLSQQGEAARPVIAALSTFATQWSEQSGFTSSTHSETRAVDRVISGGPGSEPDHPE